MTFYVVAGRSTRTNDSLVEALRALGLDADRVEPLALKERALPGDVALGRLDVLPTLDGVEPGFWELRRLQRAGVRVLNQPSALLVTHDKLATALRLARAGLPHPRTSYVDYESRLPSLETPVVVKPRFGSWGRDVFLCSDDAALGDCMNELSARPWFRRQGVLIQELIQPRGFDLRLVVAGGEVVGAVERVTAPGEWRTNVALGGIRRSVAPPPEACALAVTAAASVRADLVGVDLLPGPTGGWVVLELNGAVDFTREYSLNGTDVFQEAARGLAYGAVEAVALAAAT